MHALQVGAEAVVQYIAQRALDTIAASAGRERAPVTASPAPAPAPEAEALCARGGLAGISGRGGGQATSMQRRYRTRARAAAAAVSSGPVQETSTEALCARSMPYRIGKAGDLQITVTYIAVDLHGDSKCKTSRPADLINARQLADHWPPCGAVASPGSCYQKYIIVDVQVGMRLSQLGLSLPRTLPNCVSVCGPSCANMCTLQSPSLRCAVPSPALLSH